MTILNIIYFLFINFIVIHNNTYANFSNSLDITKAKEANSIFAEVQGNSKAIEKKQQLEDISLSKAEKIEKIEKDLLNFVTYSILKEKIDLYVLENMLGDMILDVQKYMNKTRLNAFFSSLYTENMPKYQILLNKLRKYLIHEIISDLT